VVRTSEGTLTLCTPTTYWSKPRREMVVIYRKETQNQIQGVPSEGWYKRKAASKKN
jgi:hypothetical protein